MREGLSVSVCRHWHQTLCKLLQSETLRWWALQRGTYYWAERKWTFSLSQMSNDELAQSLPWRENEGWNPTFSLSQMGKASLLVFCHGEKRCMKWPIRWGVVNRVSSHVKSQCRTVLATSNAITCLWHCGMRHRGGRTVIQACWRNVGSRRRNVKGNAESDEQGRNVPKSSSVADCPVVVLKCL